MSDWRATTLGEVVNFQRGFDITRAIQRPGKIPVVSSGGIGSYHDTASASGPGVVIGRKGTLGKTFYLKEDYWPHDTTLWVQDFKGSNPLFVYYYMSQLDVSWLDAGSANPTLNRNHLHPLSVLWPTQTEQTAIAEVLGALDEKIAANAKLADTLASLTTAEFELIAKSCNNSVPLSDLVSTQYGVTTSAHDGPGPQFLRVTDINKKPWIEWASAPNCTVSEAELKKYKINPGDILVARMADPGKAAFVDPGDPEAVFASYLVRLRAFDTRQALFIYYYLRSKTYQNYAEGATQGSVQRNMNAKVIVATDISMPGPEVLRQFNVISTKLRAQIQTVLRENLKLAETRDALLPQLMSGKLRVKDAETLVESVE